MDEQGRDHGEEVDLEPVATVRKRRPQVLWAVLAAVALAAGALVVTSADDDGNQRPGLPVDLASQLGGGGEAAAADASMRAWVTYVAGDDLPALGGEATAYRLSGDVDEADVRALADALGIDGAVEGDGAGSWWVAGDGGVGRLDVHAGSGASWSYFAGESDCVTSDGGIVACAAGGSSSSAGSSGSGSAPPCDPGEACATFDSTGVAIDGCAEATDDVAVDCAARPTTAAVPTTSVPPCVEPESAAPDQCLPPPPDSGVTDCIEAGPCPDDTPTYLPPPPESEDEARAAALAVVAASGADVEGARVTASAGGASRTWFVTVEPVVEGIPTGLVSYVEVSEDAVVVSGNGFFGQPEPLGGYPLLDTRDVIDRANAQSGVGIEPALGAADDAVSSTTGGGDGGTGVGGTTGGDEPTTTVVTGDDPCAVPDGASDGCGGTTGCGGDACIDVDVAEPPPDTTIPCKVQPDGREICEYTCPEQGDPAAGCGPTCPQAESTDDIAVGAPDSVDCTPPHPTPGEPVPGPVPSPEPQPLEVVLVDAEPSLILLPATDGSTDAYLVPAYRFTAEDGSTVDLPAITEDALAGPSSTETTVPDTVVPEPEPEPVPVPEPQPCQVLEEGDDTGTTHTVQTCPTPSEDPGALPKGEQPAIGVGYYVDIDLQCAGGSFVLGQDTWIAADDAPARWGDTGEQFEGGTFTLDAEDHGTFVGDAAATKVAEFRTLGPAEDIFCSPQPRG